MSRAWSQQQNDIFGWFAKPDQAKPNLLVRARAGTGKTTTIIEACSRAPEQSQLLAAFNKRISKELETRIRDSGGCAEAKTLHGIGYGIIQRYWERAKLDGRRGYDLAKQAAGDQAPDDMIAKVAKLASIAKGMCADIDLSTPDTLIEIAELFNLEPDDQWEADGFTTEWVATKALAAMERARHREPEHHTARIDFDDMIYLPIANGWAKPRYDLVVIDEAQDMNATQLALAMAVVQPTGRIAVVGDDRQAIYGFRGADSSALDRLKEELHATELGLNTTYRCGKVIVDYCRQLVPDFRAGENNAQGTIENLHMSNLVTTAEVGDFVLSRKNAPLVSVCLKLLRASKPARIEGKDVAAGLKAIVKRWKPKTLQDLVDRIGKWKEKEIAKLEAKRNHTTDDRIEEVKDKAEILLALTDGIAEPAELITRLETMFGDSDDNPRPAVVCSSIHRAKGLEANRVFILKNTLYPNRKWIEKKEGCTPAKALEKAKQVIEEQNLEYVACSRAKNVLVWVEG